MKHVKGFELSIPHFLVHFVSLVIQLDTHDQHNIAICQNRTEFEHVGLVVNDLTFYIGALDSGELSSADGISYSDD